MNFNNHSNLEGQHAFLGASKYHWINYGEDKVAEAYRNFLATQKGTVLHWYIMNPSKEELEDLLENICEIAAELGIHINRKKTRIVKISSKYKFLQIKYTLTDTGKVIKRINPDRVTAMRRKLKKLAVKVENEEADYDNIENMFRGWMGGHYKLLSREQRKNLIQLYEDLFSKEIAIVNKKLIVSDRSA